MHWMNAHEGEKESAMTLSESIREIALNDPQDGHGVSDCATEDKPKRGQSYRYKHAAVKDAQDAAALKKSPEYKLAMYSHKDVINRLDSLQTRSDYDSLRKVLEDMRDSHSWRALTPQSAFYVDILDNLRKRYPHFHEVIDTLRARMRLNALKKNPVVDFGANILLLGAPGCGKSSFLFDLGKSLNTIFTSISCASASTSGDLTGLSAGWSTGHFGMLFDVLVIQECANPIVLLDEVDKIQTEGSQPFASALYGLLEKNNARAFRDEYVGVPIDASKINWVASANDVSLLSAPIQDRFEVIQVNEPSEDDLRQMLPQIYQTRVHDHGLQEVFSDELSPKVIDVMLQRALSIRRLNTLIESAMASASARAGKGQELLELRVEDIPADKPAHERGRKIGFIQ